MPTPTLCNSVTVPSKCTIVMDCVSIQWRTDCYIEGNPKAKENDKNDMNMYAHNERVTVSSVSLEIQPRSLRKGKGLAWRRISGRRHC